MDINLLIISILGLVASGVCLVVGTWLFRKAPQIAKLIEKLPLPSIVNDKTEELPESTLLDVSRKLREFEEKTL
jgi:hypothetical protein